MTSASNSYQRRKLLRLLQDEHTSRREVLHALQGVQGLERWLHSEANRAGLDRIKLDTALARLGMRWASHSVKRFFLSPPESLQASRLRIHGAPMIHEHGAQQEVA